MERIMPLTKLHFVATATLIAALGIGCGGQDSKNGKGAGGTAAGSGGAVRGGAGGGPSPTGGGTGTSGATGGQTSSGGASGGTVAAGGMAVAGGAVTGGGLGSGGTTLAASAVWNDSQGNVIQAHGEGIIKVDAKYYWLGEDKTNGAAFQNVKCYSSTDLGNWTFVNNVLTR